MKKRTQDVTLNGRDKDTDGTEDTDLFSADAIVSELENLRELESQPQSEKAAWRRLEDMMEDKRLRRTLCDLDDDEFLSDPD